MPLTTRQTDLLGVKPYTQLSPYLEQCCLRASASASYQQAAEDVAVYSGICVSANTQRRLVHRQTFSLPSAETGVEELSVDRGKVRLRTPRLRAMHLARLQSLALA